MSNLALFGVGLLVTLIVTAAMALLIWGAVLDGRDEDSRRVEQDRHDRDIAGLEAVSAAQSAA